MVLAPLLPIALAGMVAVIAPLFTATPLISGVVIVPGMPFVLRLQPVLVPVSCVQTATALMYAPRLVTTDAALDLEV